MLGSLRATLDLSSLRGAPATKQSILSFGGEIDGLAAKRSTRVESLVPRPLDRQRRQHIEHRRIPSRGPRERGGRKDQRVDLQGTAGGVMLQERGLVVGVRPGPRHERRLGYALL